MKTSKLLALTFVGLLFCIFSVTQDLSERGQMISIKEMPAAAKACLDRYFPHNDAAVAKIKTEIKRSFYEMGINNNFEQELTCDNMLAYSDY